MGKIFNFVIDWTKKKDGTPDFDGQAVLETQENLKPACAATTFDEGGFPAFAAKRGEHVNPDTLFSFMNFAFSKVLDAAHGGTLQAFLVTLLTTGFAYLGVDYTLICAGSSQLRSACCTFIDKAHKRSFMEWAMCGVNGFTNILANKVLVYIGLLLSTSERWQYATAVPEPSIDRVAVFPDVEVKVDRQKVDEVGDFHIKRVIRAIVQKITDGLVILLVPDDTADADMNGFTIRAPWMKGFCVLIRRGAFLKVWEALKLPWVLKDFEETPRDIRQLDMITFKSVYKACKCRPLASFEKAGLSNWQAYVHEFKRLGHHFRICVKDHDALRSVPYQQFQSMLVEDGELDWISKRSVEKMAAYKDPHHASHLLPKVLGKVARIWPSIFADEFVREQLQNAYVTRRWRMMGGQIPALMKYRFAAPDIVAVMQGLGGAPVTGIIPADHVVCNAKRGNRRAYNVGSKLDVTRCPHLDNAHMIRTVWMATGIWRPLFTGNTMFFSAHDMSMTAMQMDFDGDHVGVISDATWVAIAENSVKRNKNVPLYYEAKSSKPSEQVTKDEIVTLLSALEPAPVGKYAFALNKVYAMGKYMTEMIALLTKAGNTCIDAAKYITGNSGSMVGAGVQSIFKWLKKVAPGNPWFIAYAKSSPFVEGSFEKRAKKCVFYVTSAVDRYSRRICSEVPAELHLDGEQDFQFRWKMLCGRSDGQMTAPGLMAAFKDVVFAKAKEASEVRPGSDASTMNAFLEDQGAQIRGAMLEWGTAQGLDADAVVNGVVAGVYRITTNANLSAALKRYMWLAFGDLILANVEANLKAAGANPAAFEDDPEEEIDVMDDFSFAGGDEDFAYGEDAAFFID